MTEVQTIDKNGDIIIYRFPDCTPDSVIQAFCIQHNCLMTNKRYIPDNEGGFYYDNSCK